MRSFSVSANCRRRWRRNFMSSEKTENDSIWPPPSSLLLDFSVRTAFWVVSLPLSLVRLRRCPFLTGSDCRLRRRRQEEQQQQHFEVGEWRQTATARPLLAAIWASAAAGTAATASNEQRWRLQRRRRGVQPLGTSDDLVRYYPEEDL